MKELSKQEIESIEAAATAHANKPHYSNGSKYSVSPIMYIKKGYIAGATEQAIKAKELVEALNRIWNVCLKTSVSEEQMQKDFKSVWDISNEALNSYNKTSKAHE